MAGLEGKAKKANTSRTKKGKSRLEKREARYGLLFVLPLIIGVIFFLGSPLIQSFAISLGDINTENGYDIAVRGWENYKRALTVDADYIKYLLESLKETATNTPLIVIVSFVVAMLLKREFPGRTVYRVIFFLPVILTSGVMSEIRTDELIASAIDPMAASEGMTGMLSGSQQVISDLLLSANLSPQLTNYILYAQQNIATVLSLSGIQVLIFLAALQSISPSLYEASAIEGATAWENFWKITLPMVSPQLLVIVLYTVIERFVNISGDTMHYIYTTGFQSLKFGYSSAMAWIYFVMVSFVVAALYFILKRFTFSYEQR